MARKLHKKTQSAGAADNPLEDLYVAMPDVPLKLAGRELTVREYRFIDGMRARAKAAPLIAALQTLTESGDAGDAGLESYLDLLARHDALVRELMADSIEGADEDFIDGLSAADGEQLLMAWWTVAGRFFWRSVVGRLRDRTLLELRRKASAGPTSSTPSPMPATATSNGSPPATPSDN